MRQLTLADGSTRQVDSGPEWCGRCEHLEKPHSAPRCQLFGVRILPVKPAESNGRLRTEDCLAAEQRAIRPTREELLARIAELESVVAAGDRLAVAVVRCGIHTWQSISAEAAPSAVAMGVRMHEYITVSPTFEWPDDEPGRFQPKTREQLKEDIRKAKARRI